MTETLPAIVEAVPVPQASLTWIRCSDESTAEVPSGPVATTGELAAILALLPPGTPLRLDDFDGCVDRVEVREQYPADADPDACQPVFILVLCSDSEED